MSLDGIKIDRSFVERLGPSSRDQAIVAAVIRMAHTLGLSVVAEGVETTEQLCILRKLGCTLGQGFLFSRPLRPDVATGLIASGHVSVHAAVDTVGRAPHRPLASPPCVAPDARSRGTPCSG